MGLVELGKRVLSAVVGGSERDTVAIPPELEGREVPGMKELWDRAEQCITRRAPMERDWREAGAFYDDKQWLGIELTDATQAWTGNFIPLPATAVGSTQIVVNRYKRNALAITGLLTSGKPIPTAVPIGIGSDDVERARGTDGLLRHIWQVAKFQNVLEEVVLWAVLTGNGFFKCYWDFDLGDPEPAMVWDPEAGEPEPVLDEAGNAVLDAAGLPQIKRPGALVPVMDDNGNQKYETPGALVIESLPPYHVGWNDGVPFDRSPYVFQRSCYDPYVLQDRFGIWCEPDTYPEVLKDGGITRYDLARESGPKTMVGVLEWWVKPCKKYPHGLHKIGTRTKDLYVGTWPKGRRIPIVHYRSFTTPGSPWGTSPLKSSIPLQMLLNRIVSDAADHLSVASNPAIIGTEEQFAGMNPSIAPGVLLAYKYQDGAPMPQPVQIAGFSEWELRFAQMTQEWDDTVSGVSMAFLGTPSDGDSSGRAISYQVERTARNFANAGTRLVQSISDVGMLALDLWREYGPEEETIRVMGPDAQAAYIPFRKESVSYRTLHLDESSVLVGSQMAINEMIERLVKAQMIPPEEGRKLIATPGVSLQTTDYAANDKSWARRNIEAMKQGEMPGVMQQMIVEVHYEVTAEYMKTAEFFGLDQSIMDVFNAYLGQLYAEVLRKQQAAAGQPAAPASPPNAVSAPAGAAGPESPAGDAREIPISPEVGGPSLESAQLGNPGQGGPGTRAEEESSLRALL